MLGGTRYNEGMQSRAAEGVQITFLGHSCVLVEFAEGPRLLTDPVLRGRIGPLRWHGARGERHAPVDGVLISHGHHDHLDLPSLDVLRTAGGEQPRLVVPAGLGPLLRRRGFIRVQEVVPGDRLALGGAIVRVTQAVHNGTRRPFGPRAEAVGYLIDGGQRVYFAGDTALFDGMADLAPDLDVALLPVWGWGPRLGAGHLDPGLAARAVSMLKPRVAIPIHWGTLYPYGLARIWPARLRDPGHEFERQVAARRIETDVRVLAPGASIAVLPLPAAELLEAAL